MTASGETLIAFNSPGQEILCLGRKNTVKLTARAADGGSTPTLLGTTTCTLYRLGDPTAIAVATVTGATGYATGIFAALSLPVTLTPGPSYQIVWQPKVTGLDLDPVDIETICCLRPLQCPISPDDIEKEYPGVGDRLLGTNQTTLAIFTQPAWEEGLRRITEMGLWPHQVKSRWSVRGPILEDALYRFSRWAYQRSREPAWLELADRHKAACEAKWISLKTTLDQDNDGQPDDPEKLDSAAKVIHINPSPYPSSQLISLRY